MSDDSSDQRHVERPPSWDPVGPSIALVPGLLLCVIGALIVADQGFVGTWPQIGAACLVVGNALFLIGAIAAGVAWGMALHESRRG